VRLAHLPGSSPWASYRITYPSIERPSSVTSSKRRPYHALKRARPSVRTKDWPQLVNQVFALPDDVMRWKMMPVSSVGNNAVGPNANSYKLSAFLKSVQACEETSVAPIALAHKMPPQCTIEALSSREGGPAAGLRSRTPDRGPRNSRMITANRRRPSPSPIEGADGTTVPDTTSCSALPRTAPLQRDPSTTAKNAGRDCAVVHGGHRSVPDTSAPSEHQRTASHRVGPSTAHCGGDGRVSSGTGLAPNRRNL
jgi:hypothetical protein